MSQCYHQSPEGILAQPGIEPKLPPVFKSCMLPTELRGSADCVEKDFEKQSFSAFRTHSTNKFHIHTPQAGRTKIIVKTTVSGEREMKPVTKTIFSKKKKKKPD